MGSAKMEPARLAPRSGTRALVVGGCGGIGRAYVDALLAAGARVAVVDLQRSFEAAPLPQEVAQATADVTDSGQVSAAIAAVCSAWDGCDLFTYVSGIAAPIATIADTELDDWRRVLDVNTTGAFLTSRAVLPWLRRAPSAVMLFVASSLYARTEANYGAYCASKGALVSLMKVLAQEGAPTIRANAVAPGLVETAFLSGGTGHGGRAGDRGWFEEKLGDQARRIVESIPLGRVAQPEDVIGPMLFLSGPASAYMTGQVLFVNGGRYAQ
jgi:3-oxoacyl-[acyl-carrier protein] reductase